MDVLAIAQYFPPDMGGGATRAHNAAKGLVCNGCNVTVIAAFPHYPTGNIPKEYRWRPLQVEFTDGIKVIRTAVPPLASQGLLKRLILFASFVLSSLFALPLVGEVDVIWAANPNIISIIPAAVYSILKGIPITLNVDDLWPEELYSSNLLREGSKVARIADLVAKLAYRKAKLITPISPGYVKIICGKYSTNPRKVYVIRAGVDTAKFKPWGKESNGKFRVLYSGAFSIAYDFDQILLAAKQLEIQGVDDVEYIIQGGGELAGRIKRGVKELKLKNVTVIDKIISRDEVARMLSEADALILPLRDFGRPYLGISSKLYEYQAAGKPIICCAKGQPAEYIEETDSGIIVKPGDHISLAEATLYLKDRQEPREKLGEHGRLNVEENLSIERIGSEMKRTLENVAERKNRG